MLLAVLGAAVAQIPVLFGAAFFAAAGVLARLRIVLPPGWVIVVLLFVLAPLGALFREIDSAGFVLISALSMLVPFVVAALLAYPHIIPRLVLLAPLALLVMVAGASLLWTPAPAYGSDKLVLWVMTGIIPAAFVLVLASAARHIGWTPIFLGATATATATLLFADPGYPPTLFETNPIWASRGAFLGALVVVFVRFPLVVKLVAVPIMVAAGLNTASLGPLLGFGAGILAGVVEALRRREQAGTSVALGWAGLALGTVTVAIAVVSGAADPLLASVYDDPNVEARTRYLGIAWDAFLESPVFGIGIGGFSVTGAHEYPHNLLAEVALELGFVGVLLLLGWVVFALRAAAGSPVLVALVVSTSAFALFSGSLGSNTELWLTSMLAVASSPLLRRSPVIR